MHTLRQSKQLKLEANDLGFLMPTSSPSSCHGDRAFGFRIGNVGFLVPASFRCEVLPNNKITPLPGIAPWISGLLNIQGNQLPVFDLHTLIDEGARDQNARRLCIIGKENKAAAIWIDKFPENRKTDQYHNVEELNLALLPQFRQGSNANNSVKEAAIWVSVDYMDLFEVLGYGLFFRFLGG